MDAASVAISELDDPRLYEVKQAVPIFRPHRRVTKDADGKEKTILVTEDDLPEIVRNMKDREAENGVCGRITDGHINPSKDAPEKSQPDCLGYVRNPRVGTFGPKKIPCVLTDHYIARGKLPVAKERKFRSSEYYPNSKDITGVALMIRDPFLDLGVVNYAGQTPVRYTNNSEPCYLYAIADGENTMADAPADMGMEKDEPLPAEEAQHYAKFCGYAKRFMKGHPKLYGMMEGMEAPVAPAAPSATDTAIPDELKKKKEEEASMNARNGDPALYARLEAAEARVATLLQKDERNKCEGIVEKLATLYKLDREVEIQNLMVRTPAEREKHIAYIKANHAPQDEQIQVYSGHVEAGTKELPTSRAMSDMAVNYATEHQLEYPDALKAVKDGKRPTKMPQSARRAG